MSSVYYKKILNYNLAYYDNDTPMVTGNTQFYTATGLHWSNSPLYSNTYNVTYEKNWEISDRLNFQISVTYRSGYYHCVGSVTFDGHTTNIEFDSGLNTKQRDFGIIIDDDISEAWCYFIGDNSRSDQTTTGVQAFTCMPYNRQLFYSYIKGLPILSTSNGGGATHISRTTGLLKSLSSNLTSLLIASGAGGGGLLVNNIEYAGADAGGIEGNGTNSANQNSGNAFGQGEDGELASGGGSGLYGGYAGIKAIIPQYLQNYVNKIASFTATLNDGRSASMMSYVDQSLYSYNLSRPYSATLETGSFDSIGSNTADLKLLNTGRLVITYNKTTSATSLSFTGFTTPSPVPLINGSRQYNYSGNVGWAGGSIQIRSNGVRDFDSSVYTTSFSDLISCLSYCADHFRNVEISVNGELWTKTGSNYYVTPLNPISGGAGSGYIGNSVLSNKKMVGYNVTTSSAVNTKTETTDIFSAIAQPNIPKKNDGWVRIAFLRTLSPDDYSYLQHINELYMKVNENWLKFTSVPANNGSVSPDSGGTFDERTYICDDFTNFRYTSQGSLHGPAVLALNGIMTIRVTVHPYSTTVTYDNLHYIDINTVWSGADWQSLVINGLSLNHVEAGRLSSYYVGQTPPEQYQSYLQASFNTLTEAIEYIYQHYAVINLYVNNSLWVSVDN